MVSSCDCISMPRTAKICSSNFRFCPILRTPRSSSSGLSAASASRFRRSGRARARRRTGRRRCRRLAMRERHVAGLVRRDRERDAAQRRLHRVVADRLDVDRDDAGVVGARDPGFEPVDARARSRSARGRSWRRAPLRAARPRAAAASTGDRRLGARRDAASAVMPPPVSGRPGEVDGAARRRRAARSLCGDAAVDGSIAPASTPANSATRRVSVVNSIAFRNAISRLWSGSCTARSASGTSSFTLSSSVTSPFEMRAFSALSISVWRRFSCLISPARASSVSRSPYSPISCAAVLTPMPGTPGTLSVESPISACTSITLSGGTPNFSITSAMPIFLSFIVSYMMTQSFTSCIRSLSDDTMVTLAPTSQACRA